MASSIHIQFTPPFLLPLDIGFRMTVYVIPSYWLTFYIAWGIRIIANCTVACVRGTHFISSVHALFELLIWAILLQVHHLSICKWPLAKQSLKSPKKDINWLFSVANLLICCQNGQFDKIQLVISIADFGDQCRVEES